MQWAYQCDMIGNLFGRILQYKTRVLMYCLLNPAIYEPAIQEEKVVEVQERLSTLVKGVDSSVGKGLVLQTLALTECLVSRYILLVQKGLTRFNYYIKWVKTSWTYIKLPCINFPAGVSRWFWLLGGPMSSSWGTQGGTGF